MKRANMIIIASAIVFVFTTQNILADTPNNEVKDAYKEKIKDNREQMKRQREIAKEDQKHSQKIQRERRKEIEKVKRAGRMAFLRL
ncbi:MAG: hypothetical protein PVI92_06590 [Chromatiales bacterium]|jgi:hypothetical protein